MNIDQPHKELVLKRENENKSPWAIIIIIIVVVLFGLFWFLQRSKEGRIPVIILPIPPQNELILKDNANNLEASIGSINIPNYSDSL